ncbi:hypothetical protein BH160DRAFT_0386 [Burkholderia sp. H160]|nr:hypothetical protein BH160DRAFT_0386 [Burkholderia sp. H160]
MSEIERIENERAVRDYYREAARLERGVLAAVRAGSLAGLPADVRAISAAVLDLRESERGVAVDDVLVDRDDIRTQWVVLVMLRNGAHRSLAVTYPQ